MEKVYVKIAANDLSGRCGVEIKSAENEILSVELMVKERKTGRSFTQKFAGNSKILKGEIFIENPLLWSINEPNLYEYTARIQFALAEETLEGCFGIRQISTDGKNVLINGHKVFIKGYIRGAAAHEHQNNCRLSEEEFYRKNILQAKKFGFNFIRFHSTVPPQSLFQAADELGMLIHIELRAPKDEYNNLDEMRFQGVNLVSDDFIKEVIDSYFNHPSLAVYCIGNELKSLNSLERILEIGKLIKEYDDSRLYLDTCAWGKVGREYVDIDVQHMSYFFPFGKHYDMFDNLEYIHTLTDDQVRKGQDLYQVPLIAHEVCHYTALRDYQSLKEKFAKYNVQEAWWIDEELKMIQEKGFQDDYPRMYRASKRFQFECWKTAFEEIRSSRLLGGYHFLQFADTDKYENSNGLVDCFDDDTYLDSREFLKFNGDKVLIVKFDKRIYSAGETVSVPVFYSNCEKEEYGKGTLRYVVSDVTNNETIFLQDKEVSFMEGLQEIDTCVFTMPKVDKGIKMQVSVELRNGDTLLTQNAYRLWCYNADNRISYSDFCRYENDDFAITDDLEKALCFLEEGKKVCLIYRQNFTRHLINQRMKNPTYSFKATWNRFKPVIWDRGTNYGGLCEQEKLKKYGFETDEFYDFNYSILTEDCDKIILDDFPVKPYSIISGIDKSCRDRFDAYAFSFNLPELQYDRTLRNFSYMFEVGVGKGKLLVCGLNLTGLDRNEPSSIAMANWIINYAQSKEFNPQTMLSIAQFKQYLMESAKVPVKERMMTQFWQYDDEPVETAEYWKNSENYLK